MSRFGAGPWLSAALVGLASPALAQTITFATEPLGVAPGAFSLQLTGSGTVGVWTVVQDEDVPGGRAFEQRTADRTDYRFPLAI